MAPSMPSHAVALPLSERTPSDPWVSKEERQQIIVEAWGQGLNVGSLVFITLIVLCNYRKNILLHKLILLELVLAIWHGFFIFFEEPVYGWILSGTAAPLYMSYTLHNVIAWIKIKPFLPRWGGWFFIISLVIVQPYWAIEAWANFAYFNKLGPEAFEITRYMEPLFRDPWWIFTTVKLVLVINKNYEYTLPGLIKTSPRFGVMLLCMLFSIVFLVTDIIVTALVSVQSGINPYWRLALVFKCASDAIFLDDFKSVLDRIAESALRYVANIPSSMGGGPGGSKIGQTSARRRGSSTTAAFRRPSAAKFNSNNSNPSRHMVHISADGDAKDRFNSAGPAEEWVESRWRSHSNRRMDRGDLEGIRADTTITIQESDERDAVGKISSASTARSGSQERILSPGGAISTDPPDYGWGSPASVNNVNRPPTAEEAGSIPMRPMRSRHPSRGDM